MSKESRRAARLARESRRLGDPTREAGGTGSGRASDGAAAGSTGSTGSAGASRPRPAGRPAAGVGARAGRRERARPGPAPTFLQRYRSLIVTIAAVAIAAIAVGYVFIGSSSAAYTCTSQFNPSPTPPVSPESSTRLGFLETNMGQSHTVANPQNYLLCPPASGPHHGDAPGVTGPIPPRVYGPNDKVGPPNWIHNLEHGAVVILYRNDSPGATAAGQQAFKDYASKFPPSAICQFPAGRLSPVVARFDDMPHMYAALVWGRVMYMDTWDPTLATRFYLTESERLDSDGAFVAPPEPQCPAPSHSAAPGASEPAPSSSTPASVVPSAPASPAASDASSASPAPSAAPS